MFYEPDSGKHGLPFNPLKACVVPRPIGWITTLKPNGLVNLAPFSQFNLVGFEPGYVMFSANTHPPQFDAKNSTTYAEATGEFVYNMATYELRHYVVQSSLLMDPLTDDLLSIGLTAAPSRVIKPPRIAESPIALECRHHATLLLPGNSPDTTHRLVIGRVVGVHIDDAALSQGKLDIARLQPLARLGYQDYTRVDHTFTIEQPAGTASSTTLRKMQGGG